MPQMSPLWWMTLMLLFMMMTSSMMIINYCMMKINFNK